MTFDRMSQGFCFPSHSTTYPAVLTASAAILLLVCSQVTSCMTKPFCTLKRFFRITVDGVFCVKYLSQTCEMKERLMGLNVSGPVILHRKKRYGRGCKKTTRKSQACAICLYVYYCNAGVFFIWFVTFAEI